MKTASLEEALFPRIVLVLGVSELVDAVVNLFTILRARSGLPIAFQVDENLAISWFIYSLIVGAYIFFGGSLFSRLAYGRPAPNIKLNFSLPIPSLQECASLAFRGFGVERIIQGGGQIAKVISIRLSSVYITSTAPTHSETTYSAVAIEYLLIGFVLLFSGGWLASFIKRHDEISEKNTEN